MAEDTPMTKARSLWGEAWVRLRRKPLAMVCLGVVCMYLAVGLMDAARFRPSEGDPTAYLGMRDGKVSLVDVAFTILLGERDKEDTYAKPGVGGHVLGADIQGENVLYKTVKGISTAVFLGAVTAAIYVPMGLLLGILAGYFGGRVDDAIVYLYSTLACIPGILLLIALMMVMGRGLHQLCIAMGVTGWVGLCRLIRGETLKLRESEYVLAARAVGAGHARIIFRHILPNLFHIVIITFTLGFSGIILSEAVLSYLGIGVEPDVFSWGTMISEAKMEVSRSPSVWWQLTAAAGALSALVLALNVFGDALRDALDPRLRTGAAAK